MIPVLLRAGAGREAAAGGVVERPIVKQKEEKRERGKNG